MRFLLKLAFWLTIVVLLMPSERAQQGAPPPQIATGDAVSATGAVVSDMRQFCVRQPDACAVGSQALVEFGYKAQAGAKMLYEFIGDKVGHEPARGPAEQVAGARKPSQNTLTPADVALPWRGPQPRRNADARHPA
ncbi:MAG TPA: DUF5330 domain-containing protein [Xanthobacteraceae bacterium]|jgi:hypothetical protein|nr:DUF5330 domain-containing protein [Xanthobacteraceae bacterium]